MFEKFHSLNPREKMLLSSLGLMIMLLSFYKLSLEKQIIKYTEIKTNLEQTQQELVQAQKLSTEAENLEEQSREVAAKLAPMLPSFNTRMHPGYVLVDFNWQAYQCGVALDKVKPLPVIDKKNYLEIPLTLHISGSYHQVIQYIKVLENLAVISEIRRADFRPPNREEVLSIGEGSTEVTHWQQSDDVRVQIDLVLFTDRDAKLNLEQGKVLGEQWLVGRPKAFESMQPISPLKQMEVPLVPAGNSPLGKELIGN